MLLSLSLGDEGIIYSLCWTTDLDYFFHMNNGKYFREMDFARWVRPENSGILGHLLNFYSSLVALN